jgi:hypothetical protein
LFQVFMAQQIISRENDLLAHDGALVSTTRHALNGALVAAAGHGLLDGALVAAAGHGLHDGALVSTSWHFDCSWLGWLVRSVE